MHFVLCIHETLKMHLSKYDKLNFVVSLSRYHTPFKRYGPDYNPTTDIDLFWTCGQFANQATILELHTI